jgi:hypothetical protein
VLVGVSLLATSALAFACRVTPLDVGVDRPMLDEDAGAPEATAPDVTVVDATPTLEQTLKARCAEPAGSSDDYFSGADLTTRLVGRWFDCGDPAQSPLQDGDGNGIQFGADGSWALLFWNDSHDGFNASTVPLEFGKYRYHFFVDSEAGAAADSGVSSSDIALDDMKNRTPLVLYLDRAGSPDGDNLTFSKSPRQMSVVESASALRAKYVPMN